MAIDLTNLSSFTTSAKALSDLVLVSSQENAGYQPQKKGEVSVLKSEPKFLFHYENENKVNLKSDVTDHYIEDNTAVNDQIALAPENITVQGFIGELNNVPPQSLEPLFSEAQEKLVLLGAYAPELTISALSRYNEAFRSYQTLKAVQEAGVASWESITGGLTTKVNEVRGSETGDQVQERLSNNTINQNEQQKAFQKFYGYWRARKLFTVQTPWAVFRNAVIENLTAIQGDTQHVTSFEITFKILRFSSTQDLTVGFNQNFLDSSNAQGRAANQSSEEQDLGLQKPVQSIDLRGNF